MDLMDLLEMFAHKVIYKVPKAKISINTDKDSFILGETITGNLIVTPEENFTCEQVRVELNGTEKVRFLKPVPEADLYTLPSNDNETPETRIYTSNEEDIEFDDYLSRTLHMYKGQYSDEGHTEVSERLKLIKGVSQQFPFKIAVPVDLGPTFQGPRRDGVLWIERTWTLEGVVVVVLKLKGRAHLEARKDVNIRLAV